MANKTNPNLKYLANNYKKKRGVVLEGASRCFSGDQLVKCDGYAKKIQDIRINEKVLSYNHEHNRHEYKIVKRIHFNKNKKAGFKIKLKNGEVIECTQDHKFFFKGRYIEMKNILSLLKR